MRIGLIGATGLVGQAALEQLLADDAVVEVRVWARQPAPCAHPRLSWQVVDFEQLASQADCSGLDSVLCCLGTTTGKAGRDGLGRERSSEYQEAEERYGLSHWSSPPGR